MKMKVKVKYVLALVAIGVFILAVDTQTRAATFGLKSHGRLVLSVNPSTSYYDLRQDSGWQTTAPAVIDFSQSTIGAGGASLSGDMHTRSSYGNLLAWGSGAVTNSNQTGAFEWQSSYIGGEPNAWYQDRLTIGSSTLAANTPVSATFGLYFTGYAKQSSAPDPNVTDVFGELDVASYALQAGTSTRSTYNPSQTVTFATYVGATINFQGKLWVDVDNDANGLSTIMKRSFDYNGGLLTTVSLTPEANYLADSQTNYATAVPEPASLALMIVAFVGTLLMKRGGRKLKVESRAAAVPRARGKT